MIQQQVNTDLKAFRGLKKINIPSFCNNSIDFILRDKRLLYTYCNEPIYLKSLEEGYHIDEIEERLTDK